MEPLALAGDLDLPVVDADGMGRAFPELQMYVPAIEGHDVTPAVLTDEKVRWLYFNLEYGRYHFISA